AWVWDFGDGNSSSAQNPNHTYAAGGTFIVTLIGTDTQGCADTISTSLSVEEIHAGISLPSQNYCVGTPVTFTDISSGATSWNWFFGDGNSSLSQNPVHAYSVPGTFQVQQMVTSPMGCTDSTTLSITVDICQSINDESLGNLKVFPNPSNGQFILEVQLPIGVNGSVRITDIYGQAVLIEDLPQSETIRQSIQLTGVSSGVYFLTVRAGDYEATQKLIIR
ncbi:MAG: hypothetical protein RLZZ519_2126, partial [Bacteroidota bacterium]